MVRPNKSLLPLRLLTLATVLTIDLGQAAPLTWTFSGVAFQSGSVTGSFVYDDFGDPTGTMFSVSDIDIVTPDGTTFPYYDYSCPTSNTCAAFVFYSTDPGSADLTGAKSLRVYLTELLTDAGGVVPIASGPGGQIPGGVTELTCGNPGCANNDTVVGYTSDGDLVATPESSTFSLLGLSIVVQAVFKHCLRRRPLVRFAFARIRNRWMSPIISA